MQANHNLIFPIVSPIGALDVGIVKLIVWHFGGHLCGGFVDALTRRYSYFFLSPVAYLGQTYVKP